MGEKASEIEIRTENFVLFEHVVFKIPASETDIQTNRQTHRHTHCKTVFHFQGEVINYII